MNHLDVYLQPPEPPVVVEGYPLDGLGRPVLPLDEVVIAYASPKLRGPIYATGKVVKGSRKAHSVWVKLNEATRDLFAIDTKCRARKIIPLKAEKLIRVPGDMNLRRQMIERLTRINLYATGFAFDLSGLFHVD